MEIQVEEKEKKICFFDILKDINHKSNEFWARVPRNEWVPFNSIPYDLFPIIWGIIDRSSNITVDKNYTEFMIMNKLQFPNHLAREL